MTGYSLPPAESLIMREEQVCRYEKGVHGPHEFYYHFQKRIHFRNGRHIDVPKITIHLMEDGAQAVVVAGIIQATGQDRIPRVEITKAEFEEAFRKAMTIIRDNHKE